MTKNLSRSLVGILANEFPGSQHVSTAGLATAPDEEIWNYAQANGFEIVSKDADFQQRALLYGSPPKVIWVRLGNGPTSAVAALLKARSADIQAFVADPAAAFLVLS